jgi:DnaK suppressor protein
MTAPKAKKAAASKKATQKVVAKKASAPKAKPKSAVKPSKAAKSVKPTAKKVVAKKAPAKKVAAKKAVKPVAKKVAAKKVVAKKASPQAKVTAKAKTKAKPATKAAVKSTKSAKPAKAVTKPAAKPIKPVKKIASKAPVAKKVEKAPKADPVVTAKAAPKATPKSVAKENSKAMDETQKKSPRAAKAISLMPPPPGQMVASTTAKASYTPMATPQLPTLVPVVHKKDTKLTNNWKTKALQDLSDEEVLSMPDSEYMNDTQMAFFRLKLTHLKADILANAEGTTEHLREDTVVVPDPADRATIEEEHALELRTRDRERKLLKKIEQSITRIDAGDYGYCDETGEPIGVGRLLARPTATLSLEAQQRRELKQKMFGD